MHAPMAFAVQRWRLLVAIAGGILAGAAAAYRILPGSAVLVGWVTFAAIFVATTVAMFLTTDEAMLRRHAALEDENKGILTTLILAAVAASVAVALLALRDSKMLSSHHPLEGVQWWVLGLASSTLVLSWLMAQCLFVLHYAHRYFGDTDSDGHVDGGIDFPGEKPSSYRDFVYVAVCIGATCQVSDFDITTSRFRGLVTAHALFAFSFNTMIVALGVNILAGMLSQ